MSCCYKSEKPSFDCCLQTHPIDLKRAPHVEGQQWQCNGQYTCLEDTEDACSGKPDGDYQLCSDCGQYASCVNGQSYSGSPRQCPNGWRWMITSSRQGYCSSSSSTCNNCPDVSRTHSPPPHSHFIYRTYTANVWDSLAHTQFSGT